MLKTCQSGTCRRLKLINHANVFTDHIIILSGLVGVSRALNQLVRLVGFGVRLIIKTAFGTFDFNSPTVFLTFENLIYFYMLILL